MPLFLFVFMPLFLFVPIRRNLLFCRSLDLIDLGRTARPGIGIGIGRTSPVPFCVYEVGRSATGSIRWAGAADRRPG